MKENLIHIAVLPLTNSEVSTVYLSDGISDAIINKLSFIPELKIISRTSSFHLRNSELNTGEISEKLGINTLIEGNARFLGNKIKVMINLISSNDDDVIWSAFWEDDITNLFNLENEIAESVAENIRDHFIHFDLNEKEKKEQGKIEVETYKKYLKANHLNFNWNVSDGLEALSLYDEVIQELPDFYEAYIQKMNCYSYLVSQMAISSEEANATVSNMIQLMEQKQVQSADLKAAKGGYYFWESWNFKEAFNEIRDALHLNPSHTDAHLLLGLIYALSNNLSLGLKHFNLAIQLDPLSANKYVTKSWGLYLLGKFEDCITTYDEALRLNPRLSGYQIKIKALIAIGQNLDELYQDLDKNTIIDPLTKEGLLGLISAAVGDNTAAAHHTKNLIRFYETTSNEEVSIYLMQIANQQKDVAMAIKYLKRAYKKRYPMLVGNVADPLLDNIRENPEFKKIKLQLQPLENREINIQRGGSKEYSKEWVENFRSKLLNLMDESRPFLDASVSLRVLASQLEITPNSLSWLINNEFQKNFNEFINEYRVNTFIEKVKDPSLSHLSLLGLAFDSGFNSKSSFNTIFKKMTGLTPSDYIKLEMK